VNETTDVSIGLIIRAKPGDVKNSTAWRFCPNQRGEGNRDAQR
jgi:hypothetical protein